MKETVVLVDLRNPKKQQTLSAVYEKEGRVYFVDSEGDMKSLTVGEYKKAAADNSISIKQYVFRAEINNLQKGMTEQEVKTTHLGLTLTMNGDTKQAGEIEWWKNHPLAMVDGVINGSKIPYQFVVTDVNKKKNVKAVNFQKKLDILKHVNDVMPEAELRNALIYLGSSPVGKSKTDIIMELVEEPAIIFKGDNLETFERVFVRKEDVNANLLLSIAKGKLYGLVSLKGIDNAKGWYYKEAFCGVSDKDVEVYFTRNSQVLTSMSAEIERIEGMGNIAPKENMIPKESQTEDINDKATLMSKLNRLVNDGHIVLPEGTLIPTLSIDSLKAFISMAKEPKEVKEPLKEEKVVEEKKVETTDETKGFEKQTEFESTVQYKGRLNKQITVLLKDGKIPEISNRLSLKIPDLENILTEYYKTLGA